MNARDAGAALLGGLFLALFILLVIPPAESWTAVAVISPAVGEALWGTRTYEALLQGMIILSGVLSILLLLGKGRPGRQGP